MSGTPAQETTTAQPTEAMTMTRYVYRYHNDSLYTLNVLILSLVILIGLLGFFIFVQLSTEPSPLIYKLNDQMQIIKAVPLNEEGISTAALLNWVNEFVMKAFSFNYSNVEKQAGRLTPYFSDVAMKLYADLLTTDENLQNIGLNKFVVSVTPKSAPEILVGKAFEDRYAWQIEVPVTLVFSNALYKATEDVVLDFLVWRVPVTESDLGIKVATFTHRVTARSGIQGIKKSI